jgi:hypothetical protein
MIEKTTFRHNLHLTQVYCARQLRQPPTAPYAAVLRNTNPLYEGKPFFRYDARGYALWPGGANEVRWDAVREEAIITQLYHSHLAHKQQLPAPLPGPAPVGRLLAAAYEETLWEGYTELVTEGLFDNYDYPPLDTWVYKTTIGGRALLIVWMPEAFFEAAQQAIDTSSTDMFGWLVDWYPAEYARLLGPCF